ncbi:MAG: NrdH-redoxin [Candidatus Wildermuthbacteria bacterium RIFCSPHIGHO2_12_FULL_45_9]|uniref:NrdH-redoxin n=1 Tax=Candidatus Wildermuthbacteria bacterium RIFCSPHIGHO2_02_FULL_45_25 TaxID=1802450 RepID=A0A1G2R5Y3_9BACT|nr:MAG: NrdH-redoxin [Candidatus Wildermuthbacteria bacterium RIFCSPHIGHO2_01_FULL_45_20]OHA67501.1 MAG: NrdH-redoxin [Candidatus Wildermuthbacteria bacterium RIFCSPHIGHO2_02_FULL_45_25]OHA72114.1 MAG: NrdH-redoxin [Candidatus Wildermuthbacteria bacterium RIFCSPHIGHO2_12_FULL_45_9]
MEQTKKVTIFTTPTCVYCRAAKDFFQDHNIAYEEKDVVGDEQAREYMMRRSEQMGVPVIEVGEDIVIGFDKRRLSQLLGIA